MKLLVYTIGGQKIGIDIQTWNDSMLSGNAAFLAIEDGGTIPTDYVDISSTSNWDNFGHATTASTVTIKEEIIKLIPDIPTADEYPILEGYMNVGINKMTNIDSNITLGSQLIDGHLSGVTDTKFATSGGTVGSIAGESGILNVSSHMNVAGNSSVSGSFTGSGGMTMAGTVIISGNMTVTGAITNPAVNDVITGATNLGVGEGISTGVTDFSLQLKSLSGGSNVTLTADGDIITISAAGSTGGTTIWGGITGTLSDQTDLQNALDAKLNTTLFNTYTGTTAPTTFAQKTDAITGATNVGTGEGLYTGITVNKLQIKSLIAGTDVSLTSNANSITINASGGGTGGTTIYGSEYQTAMSLGDSTTTSTTPQTKVTLNTTTLPTGTYKVTVAWVGTHNSDKTDMRFDVTLNGTSQGTTIQVESKDVTSIYPFIRILYLTLNGTNTILLRYWNEGNSTTISDATIELIRVS